MLYLVILTQSQILSKLLASNSSVFCLVITNIYLIVYRAVFLLINSIMSHVIAWVNTVSCDSLEQCQQISNTATGFRNY